MDLSGADHSLEEVHFVVAVDHKMLAEAARTAFAAAAAEARTGWVAVQRTGSERLFAAAAHRQDPEKADFRLQERICSRAPHWIWMEVVGMERILLGPVERRESGVRSLEAGDSAHM